MSKAVAKSNTALAEERPKFMGKVESGRGNEGVTTEDMTIPRLSIIQDLSPQHKKSKAEYIEGAEAGMIFNTVTGDLFTDGVTIVPVLFRKEYVIWKDINAGGGFRGAFDTLAEAKAERDELEDGSQCEIVDTAQHFVLILNDDGSTTAAVISMSKSQMKVSRKLNSIIQANGGDRWERAFKLSVVDDKNAAGQEYYNWRLNQLGFVNEDTFRSAEKLYEAVRAGAMDVNRQSDSESQEEAPKSAPITEDDDF